jgi:transposase
MPRQQRTYTKEFKQEAVGLVQTSGKSMSQVARDLGISDSVLSHWYQQAKTQGAEAFPGSGHQTAQEEEIRRLKRELALAQQERDILKKTLAIFTKGSLG